MERGDVVHVLGVAREALVPGGVLLDLQVVPPQPVIEVEGRVVCVVEGDGLLRAAAEATAVVDDLVARGVLQEEAVDDHDALQHYPTGAALVADFENRERSLPATALPELVAIEGSCVMRERCRARRLRLLEPAA